MWTANSRFRAETSSRTGRLLERPQNGKTCAARHGSATDVNASEVKTRSASVCALVLGSGGQNQHDTRRRERKPRADADRRNRSLRLGGVDILSALRRAALFGTERRIVLGVAQLLGGEVVQHAARQDGGDAYATEHVAERAHSTAGVGGRRFVVALRRRRARLPSMCVRLIRWR